MAVLVDKHTRVVCQGLTGKQGRFHIQRTLEYGTQVVAGVTPGKGQQSIMGIPVFDDMQQAVQHSGANASLIFVPAPQVIDAVYEAIDADIKIMVCVSEGVPVHDMIRLKAVLKENDAYLIGPNCPGIITPDQCKLGIMPGSIFKPGSIGIISRSSTLTYEAVYQTTQNGLGQSTCISIGNDPVTGMSLVEGIELFERDRQTKGIIIIGEMGSHAEFEAMEYVERHVRKPVVMYIAGSHALGKQLDESMLHGMTQGSRSQYHRKIKDSQKLSIAWLPSEIGAKILDYFTG